MPEGCNYVKSPLYLSSTKCCCMNRLKRFFKTKAFALTTSKAEKELLELFITSKQEYDNWLSSRSESKIRFQFYYPNAIDFYYSDFKLFTAYFKKGRKHLELMELKMTETNFDSIRCANWRPFEEVILEFITSQQENKKIALFEKRKMLYEYETLCVKQPETENAQKEYGNAVKSQLAG